MDRYIPEWPQWVALIVGVLIGRAQRVNALPRWQLIAFWFAIGVGFAVMHELSRWQFRRVIKRLDGEVKR